MSTTDQDNQFKLLVVGSAGVGKSSLMFRFADGSFHENIDVAMADDHKSRSFEVNGKMVKVQIWDTAGQEKFRTITSSYYRGAHGVAVCFDLTDRGSFNDVRQWVQELNRYCSEDVSKILIGHKVDLSSNRVVPAEEAQELSKTLSIPYFEASAKTGQGVDDAFVQLTQRIQDQLHSRKNDENDYVDLSKKTERPAKKKSASKCNIL